MSRHRSAGVRQEILTAAAAELADVGAERASLRSIARRVGITHQAVAHHFADRRAVLTAVAVDGVNRLLSLATDAVARVPANVPLGARTAAIGAAYVRFARENRALFSLTLVGSTQVEDSNPDLVTAQARMWQFLLETVTEESDRGWGGPLDAQSLAIMAWTFTHGMATLDERLFGDFEVDDLMRTLDRAIISTPTTETD
ncbi:TetR/AcrR family transcriptional regulator [Kibdelosporangium phytohabitans]|uniref:HTH tetR-type domain-containing protein n=1 Tax=Kibdelosporangium phytohabitans TaxID=860235 RepID=A0A0N9I974_9PSEU|nr:TetR/AcrR family transcriptional regulator [Kibdelosporangium phytohabitans]ALG11300.1 hypothetical protein AOZ06_34435 [Kibdelosporangium phytohabitans]MBE1462597.1 AcrR family transcriptional regulator [Kibdelosporangium phytohabitans]